MKIYRLSVIQKMINDITPSIILTTLAGLAYREVEEYLER